jgi:hypothetical protein
MFTPIGGMPKNPGGWQAKIYVSDKILANADETCTLNDGDAKYDAKVAIRYGCAYLCM